MIKGHQREAEECKRDRQPVPEEKQWQQMFEADENQKTSKSKP